MLGTPLSKYTKISVDERETGRGRTKETCHAYEKVAACWTEVVPGLRQQEGWGTEL